MDHFTLDLRSKAKKENIVEGKNYRFTILNQSLIRIEYQEEGEFLDQATQVVWYRDMELNIYQVRRNDDQLIIETDEVILTYVEGKKPSSTSLKWYVKGTGVNYFYQTGEDNLGGTARTLDDVSGETPLGKGLISRRGFEVIDDSKSLILNPDSSLSHHVKHTDLYLFAYGHDYRQALKDFYMISGKTQMIPRYALGNWWSRYWEYSDSSLAAVVNNFNKLNIPLSVCIIDMDWHITDINPKYGSGWTGYTWNQELFKDPAGFIKWLHSKGLTTALNLHPADGIRPHEEAYEAVCKRLGLNPDDDANIEFDFTNPKFIEAYFKDVHHPHEAMGVDFWWIDWQQGNATLKEGLDPLWILNHTHYLDLARNSEKRPFIFSRWPGLGGHRYPIGFSGDTHITWDSLRYQPYFTSTASNVGYGWWSHDIGGHFNGAEDSELYTRWVQFGVFSPIMRLHSSKYPYYKREPWKHNIYIQTIVRRFMRLRHQMIPYLYTMNYQNEFDSLTLIEPMYYQNPDDLRAYEYKDQYRFGRDLIVSPSVNPTTERSNLSVEKVYLPEGNYYNFFTGTYYKGNQEVFDYARLDDMCVYAKEGSIIPLDGALKENGVENPEVLKVNIYGCASNHFDLYEDDGVSNHYKNGNHVITRFETTYDGDFTIKIHQPIGNTKYIPGNRTVSFELFGVDLVGYEKTKKGTYLVHVPYSINEDTEVVLNALPVTKHPVIKRLTEVLSISSEDVEHIMFIDHAINHYLVKDKLIDFIQVITNSQIPEYLKQLVINIAVQGEK